LPKRPSAFAFEVMGFGSVTVMPADVLVLDRLPHTKR
jgi:hypothetical protein